MSTDDLTTARAIRDEEERRRQSREAQRRLRARVANTLKKRIFPPAGTPAADRNVCAEVKGV